MLCDTHEGKGCGRWTRLTLSSAQDNWRLIIDTHQHEFPIWTPA